MGKWQIGEVGFSTKEDYRAACRDLKRIQAITAGVDLEDRREAGDLYEMLKKQPFLFESELGMSFRSFLCDKSEGIARPKGDFPVEVLYGGKARKAQQKRDSEGKLQSGRRKKSGREKKLYLKFLFLFGGAALILFALYRIFSYDIWSYISEKKMEELASCILMPIVPEVSEEHRIADLIASGLYTKEEAVQTAREEIEKAHSETIGENGILYRYSVLYERNAQMAGWIEIADTVVNYPVMLTPDDEEYYLKKGFDKKYDINGIPFLDARCSVKEPTANFLIYGHNMKNGSMFSTILKYEQEAFYEEHPVIRFDTVYERAEYEIISVFRTQIPYEEDVDAFRYYAFIDTKNRAEYDAYIRTVKELSFYDTGITAEYGTQLLTLSTCDRSVEAGRFVVVARKKK